MSLFRMTQKEYDCLNPPPDILLSGDEGWHYLGHIPAPKTRIGWFVHDVLHGLAMRYRLLPVLVYALEGLIGKRQNSATTIRSEEDSGGPWADYDEMTDTLIVYFDGKVPSSVNWIDNRCATLLEDDEDRIVGFVVQHLKLNPTKERQ